MPNSIQQAIRENDLLSRVYEFIKEIHRGEKRPNSDTVISHCLSTAKLLHEWHLDAPTIAAGLLHDTHYTLSPEESLKTINQEFGEEVGTLIKQLREIGKVPYSGTESRTDNIRKLILYLSQDIRVIFIKFAARLDSLQSLYAFPEEKQKEIALKTMDIYAPIARQLGVNHIAGLLEDLSFPYLFPEDHRTLIMSVKDRVEERAQYLEDLKPLLKKEFEKYKLKILYLDSRPKRYFSLYKKLLRYDMDLDKIHDLVAIRVIVPTISDCYTALGVIHKMWPPLSGRIKDYIAIPKENGYRSLHTTVYTPREKITEIQIRTPEIHQEAELGIAAHFAYADLKGTKSYNKRLITAVKTSELELIKELRNSPKRLHEIGYFKEHVLTLTPQGKVIDLPIDATPVDFAYKIHTEIGHTCIGAKVNNVIVPLHTPLKSGDVIYIMTQRKKKPSASWLEFVKSSHAREAIKDALRDTDSPLRKIRQTKIKLAVENRVGLLSDIKTLISKAKIKIQDLSVQPKKLNQKFQIINIISPTLNKERLGKLLSKLKGLKEVKKAEYINK
jgi:GTP diphosphokinase / guanosine-3',5'-bis(diphosphate) 3'-diphosphatase